MWIVLSQLANGGLERVQVNIASELKKTNIDVSIITRKISSHFATQIDEGIPLIELSPSNKCIFPYRLIRKILSDKPSVIMTTSNDIACIILFANIFLKKKINLIISHHLSLSEPIVKAPLSKKIKLIAIKLAMRMLLPYANNIVAVSDGVATDIAKTLNIKHTKIHVIYNPIITKDFDSKIYSSPPSLACFTNNNPTIIYVGRICPEKRLDIILQAARDVNFVTPINLLIAGDGPSLDWLKGEIRAEELGELVFLTGFVENPLPLMKKADVLVLASDYEGFGNVLVEALACKTQVISTDCPYGPSEILDHGKYGQLIPTNTPDALTSAILNTLSRNFYVEEEILHLRAMEFSVEIATEKYMLLINQSV
jgi:glycosyltransferase involved in cell wall biosynthesis